MLRGLIDAGDYKQYIFPLVFLKRLSDVYDEEHAAALDDLRRRRTAPTSRRTTASPSPTARHWNDIREVTHATSARDPKAMRAIESANPDTPARRLRRRDWGNKDLLPDATLRDLIEHFSTQTLSIANVPEDELGNGYEYLIKKFADDSGHTAQEFYTNRTLVHLMTLMLTPSPASRFTTPPAAPAACSSPPSPSASARARNGATSRLYGQELQPT